MFTSKPKNAEINELKFDKHNQSRQKHLKLQTPSAGNLSEHRHRLSFFSTN